MTQLTFGVFDDFGVIAFHDGDARVGGSQVDSDDSKSKVSSSRSTYVAKAL